MVFAKAPAGQQFEVGLDTEVNAAGLKGNEQGEVEGFLHYGISPSTILSFLTVLDFYLSEGSRPDSPPF